MKKYQVLGLAVMATFAMTAAQDGTMQPVAVSAELRASTTMPRPKMMPPLRKEIKEDRKEMHDQNQEDRKDLRVETRGMLKSATSAEDRKEIRNNQMEKRDDMRASNTEERKEMKERSRDLAKNRVGQVAERFKLVTVHLENALTRTEKFISNKKASSTVDMSAADALLVKAKSSLANVKSGIAGVESMVSASTTLTVENKEAIKVAVKSVQDNIKTFQDDLKNLLTSLKTNK